MHQQYFLVPSPHTHWHLPLNASQDPQLNVSTMELVNFSPKPAFFPGSLYLSEWDSPFSYPNWKSFVTPFLLISRQTEPCQFCSTFALKPVCYLHLGSGHAWFRELSSLAWYISISTRSPVSSTVPPSFSSYTFSDIQILLYYRLA